MNDVLYFAEARDAITSAIAAAERDDTTAIRAALPDKALSYFDKLGRSLRDGEAFEFRRSGSDIPARLTRDSRRRLVLASSKAQAFTEVLTVRGTIPEADQEALTFQVQLSDGRKIPAVMSEPHVDTIVEAFNGYRAGTRVMIEGIGRSTRNGRLERLESIERLTVLDALDIDARLDELRELKDGWLDGEGVALDRAGLDWLSAAFDAYLPDDAPLPFLYPTASGGVRAEWAHPRGEASLDIDIQARTGAWHDLQLDNGHAETKEIDLSTQVDWHWLGLRVKALTGDSA